MKTLNKIGIGAALVGSTLAFSTVGISSAQAFIVGEVNIAGGANITNSGDIDPLTESIVFSNAFVLPGASGSFAALTPLNPGELALSTIDLVRTGPNTYSGTAGNPFLAFTNGWTFEIDNPFTANRTVLGNATLGNLTSVTTSFTGKFFDTDGETLGAGLLTANNIVNGSFSATLVATSVPEPTTTLGLAALGLGAFFSKSMAKKKKELVNA